MTSPFSYQKYGSTATTIDILLGSMSGMHKDTAEIQTTYNSAYIGEIVSRITHAKRPVSFSIPVSASSESELNTAIRTYCTMFTPSENPAKLFCSLNTPARYLNVYPSGTPDVEYKSTTCAFLTVNLTATNPYWYDSSTPTTYSSGDTITNNGDYPAPVFMTASSSSITLSVSGTVTHTISERTGYTISGTSISVDDSTVIAEDSGTNALSKFDISSQWFMIPVGESVVTGADSITISQRWSAP